MNYLNRLSDKTAVVAKVSVASLQLEREFYIIKRLYQSNDGSQYLVRPLEYINLPSGMAVAIYADEGCNYQQKLDDVIQVFSQETTTPYDLSTFLRFAIQCTDCLEFIHRHNTFHGEVRLSAFQYRNDRVKLWNFGSNARTCEKYLTSEGWRKTASHREAIEQLLVYMSPEQTGRTTYTADHRSDIYSLGIVFFILLTGQTPFEGGPLEILNGILSRKVPLVHEIQFNVPEIVSSIVEKMTNKTPDDRYSSMHGIRSDLKECLRRLTLGSFSEPIAPFTLAQHDIASVFTLPKTLYGREAVISEMTYMIERHMTYYSTNNTPRSTTAAAAARSPFGELESDASSRIMAGPGRQKTTLVGVYGPGGIGKSTLFRSVQPTARKNGYIATAKFDSRNKVPYVGVLRPLSQILQQILSEPEEEIRMFNDHLKMALGAHFSNINTLVDLVPELKTLVYETPEYTKQHAATNTSAAADYTGAVDNIEARNRFQNLYVEIMRAICQWRMTTLFLDDLHQADEPSLDLLQALINCKVNVLVFISYRDQELNDAQNALLHNDVANTHLLKIEPLDKSSLLDLLCDVLHRPRENTETRDELQPLAEVIDRRTKGNAFYATQFLQTLERKKLIWFDWEASEWTYDLKKIEESTLLSNMKADSQLDVGFMVAKLKELSRDGQHLLKLASSVGDSFSWEMVRTLMMDCELDDDSDTGGDSTNCSMRGDDDDDDNHSIATKTGTIDPISGLHAVLQEGYVVQVGTDEFKWSHDRITQAATELIKPKLRQKIHFKIAQHLMQDEQVDTLLTAEHLLKCTDLLLLVPEKAAYRQLMINAGNQGMTSGAHSMAFAYYKLALELSDSETEWNDDEYATTIQLYSNALAMSFINGAYEMMQKLLESIYAQARNPLDRVTAYQIQSRYYLAVKKPDESRDTLLECYRDLGIKDLTFSLTRDMIQEEYSKLGRLIDHIGMNKLPTIELSDDPFLVASLYITDELLHVMYWTGQKQEMYFLACRMLNLSIERGMTPFTGSACTIVGMGYVDFFQQYSFGEEIGRIGTVLADKYGGNYGRGRSYMLYSMFCCQWNHHNRECVQWYSAGASLSHCAGDRIFAQYHEVMLAVTMLHCGYNLADVLRQAEDTYHDIHAWSSKMINLMKIIAIVRVVKALQGRTYVDTPNVFDGDDGFNDAHFVQETCRQHAHPDVALNWYESYKLLALVLYGYTDKAIEVGRFCFNTMHCNPCVKSTREALFYYSLALIDKIRQGVSLDKREEYLAQIKLNQEILYEWVIHSRINYVMYWTLIQAEMASLDGGPTSVVEAIRLYEEAMNQAREGEWHLVLTVVHEYAGAFYSRIGMHNLAYGLTKKAIDLYTTHGSYGKARQLSTKFATLLAEYNDDRRECREAGVQTDPTPFLDGKTWSSATSSSPHPGRDEPPCATSTEIIPPVTTEQTLMTLDIIDMASILKSSQVLASEVKSDRLLTNMMTIILENSGADSGVIVIKEEKNISKKEKYGIGAYGCQQEGETSTTYDPPRDLSDKDDMTSSRIIHHAINTRENLFIPEVARDPRFAVGPWFENAGNKSVICMPIIHRNSVAGCLFIEGPVGIFTRRHIMVLSLLCQQMGISLTNANLFKSIHRVTKFNTAMIEQLQVALEEAKRSKKEAEKATRLREIFLANMSHEIRTPFAGFYGMISLLADTRLDPEQYDLVMVAKSSCENLLKIIDDLLNFSKLQAGKVSLDLCAVVVEDMIGDVIDILMATAFQKRINITYTLAKDVPSVIKGDANRLRQVLINLLGNAIKFTHEGEIHIRCSVEERDHQNDNVKLLFEVIDTGIGISDEQQKVLFMPFSQVDGSTTRKYGGTGLGLSISLQLVKLMGGEIRVTSTPGQGSNFNFSIQVSPLVNQSAQQDRDLYDMLQHLLQVQVLVAAKHQSTIDMIQNFLPGVSVEGACNFNDFSALAQDQQQRRGSTSMTDKLRQVIVIDVLLANDPDFSTWLDQMYRLVDAAHCTIVMHYPTNGGNHPSIMVLNQPSQRHNLFERNNVVPIAAPVRRTKLLRIILRSFQDSSSSPYPSVRRGSSRPVTKPASESITEQERALFKTMNILVAEDNPVAQKLIYKQLVRFDFSVTCANNGAEAVAIWQKQPEGYFQMGFFDHHMPKCDGVEATKRIRKMEAHENRSIKLPIVALTADIQHSAKDLCMNAGMNDYLTKPLNQSVLVMTLRRFCCHGQNQDITPSLSPTQD
ncbi:hypothetical protein K492DRAFT_168413 [Lichtheimia hyalospora FSU 10163]|nr:hypothetical protein K492DRAFT_168413 [Lichtheimia hyalospora FSU 10163]